MTDFLVYDVFTTQAFGGNPLAVIPDASGLDEALLQKIAREFNFSETTFVTPPEDPNHTARVRIFTPTQEIPFAGHPTIGTAIALDDLGVGGPDKILELGVGPIPARVAEGRAEFETRVPLTTWPGPSPEVVAASVGLTPAEVLSRAHPPVIASVGLPFAIAELSSADALARAQPNADAFRAFEPEWPADTHYDLLVYIRESQTIRARMFAPLDGIPEDPATGSAAAALVAYFGQLEGASGQFSIAQGVEMGRPSQIEAAVDVEDGAPVAVRIGGRAVQMMAGLLTF